MVYQHKLLTDGKTLVVEAKQLVDLESVTQAWIAEPVQVAQAAAEIGAQKRDSLHPFPNDAREAVAGRRYFTNGNLVILESGACSEISNGEWGDAH